MADPSARSRLSANDRKALAYIRAMAELPRWRRTLLAILPGGRLFWPLVERLERPAVERARREASV